MTNKGSPKQKTALQWLSKPPLVISSFLCVVLLFTYIIQPDICAAVTFWPIWIWAIPGIALALASIRVHKKESFVVTSAWILLVVFIAEEPFSLLRIFISRDCKKDCINGTCMRVASLNCAGGNIKAAEKLSQYAPDIVLLQESPPGKDIEILAQILFADKGEFVTEGDTAILARGNVTKSEISRNNLSFMTGARVRLPSGIEIEVVSVHLLPPAAGINLLSLDCWREHIENRQQRRRRLANIKEYIDSIEQTIPIIIGGDFNAAPWNGIRGFSARLNDSFMRGGVGWPGTGPSHCPLWRVDQIWISKHFTPVKVRSEHNKNSDHRIVICDLCAL